MNAHNILLLHRHGEQTAHSQQTTGHEQAQHLSIVADIEAHFRGERPIRQVLPDLLIWAELQKLGY